MCLRPKIYLDLGFSGPPVPFARLDSKLLLTWAKHLTHIAVDDSFLTAPGVAAFLDRASKLVHISASCFTLVTAGLADQLFTRCASITTLELLGLHLPALQNLGLNLAQFDEYENHHPGCSSSWTFL